MFDFSVTLSGLRFIVEKFTGEVLVVISLTAAVTTLIAVVL